MSDVLRLLAEDPEFGGHKDFDREALWVPQPKQREAIESEADIIGYAGEAGAGKACYNGSMVHTPYGWRAIETLKPGDFVSGVDGGEQRVLGVFPQGERDLLRLTFSDGATVVCDHDHIWRVRSRRGRKVNGEVVMADQLVLAGQLPELIARKGPAGDWTVPPCGEMAGNHQRFEIDGYVLGVLIGDGSFRLRANPSIVCAAKDAETLDRWEARASMPFTSRAARGAMFTALVSRKSREFRTIRELGYIGKRSWEKFLPKSACFAPAEWRKELLRGLMDTDGTADKKGHAYYATSSPQLAEDVLALARSLGHFATLGSKIPTYTHNGERKEGRRAYTVHIKARNPEELFWLARKRARVEGKVYQSLRKKIVSVEPAGRGECTCIKVSNPDGLFVTDGFTVTHNSDLLAFYPLYGAPGAHAVLIREEFSTLQSLRERISEVIKTPDAVTQKQVHWPNGATTTFGHIKQWADVRKHQGRAREYHLFDELGHLKEDWFRAVIGWNRSARQIPCHVLAGTNPPFPDPLTGEMLGEWVIDFFAPWVDDEYAGTPAESGELRYFVRAYDAEQDLEVDVEVPDREPVLRTDHGWPASKKNPFLFPRSRTFIHASLDDNAYIGDDYRAGLDALPGPMRDALRDGRWRRAAAGGDEFGVVPPAWVAAGVERWREAVKQYGDPPRGGKLRALGVDPSRGGSNATVIAPLWELPDGRPFVGKTVRQPGRVMPDGAAVARVVLSMLSEFGCSREQLRNWATEIRVDAVGIGSAVVDALKHIAPARVKALNGRHTSWMRPRGAAFHAVQIANARTEYYWRLREGLDPQTEINLCLPPDANLRRELRATRWENTPQGLRLEEKDHVRKRIQRSPDTADAISYALASPISLHIAVA